MMETHDVWDIEIQPKYPLLDIRLKELWHYRDLLILLVKRDYKASYKQTILGPFWFFIQPILTTLIYIVIFGNIAKLGTDGKPQAVFYLSGVIMWNYFSSCLTSTSSTFTGNANIFGKVYFPRLIIPLSVVTSNLIKFGIQFVFFISVLVYFMIVQPGSIAVSPFVFITPLLLIIMGLLGLSLGLLISSVTTKYRDFIQLVAFGVQLLMYATPVVYPMSILSAKYQALLFFNPMTGVIETFRYIFIGSGTLNWTMLGYSAFMSILLLIVAVIVFNRVEKGFIDTV